jgi:beta-phosphoglucomutase-like phosphatase (HAD superfamily)
MCIEPKVIVEEEMLGCERMVLRPHLGELLAAAESSGIRVALSTRNCEKAVQMFLTLAGLPSHTFAPSLHRDSLDGVNKPGMA